MTHTNVQPFMQKTQTLAVLGLSALLVATFFFCLSVGPVKISPIWVFKALLPSKWLHGEVERFQSSEACSLLKKIVLELRLPRTLMGMLVGGALAISGCAVQGVFRNPMASPYVIGISSGASCGAALSIVLGAPQAALPPASFLFALGSAFLVYALARVGGQVPVGRLLLSGIAVSLFLSALLSLVQYVAGERQLREIVFWLMGGLWSVNWSKLLLSALPICVGVFGLLGFSKELDALSMGEETALDLGVEAQRVRGIVLLLASLATAGAVCAVGVIGFVGLIVPHLIRLIVGPGHRLLLPLSLFGGAIFLSWMDLFARTVIAPSELPVGILTALFGAPFFLWILRRSRKSPGW